MPLTLPEGIDRIEHFMGGDAIAGDKAAYSSLEVLDVTRPEVDAIGRAYLKRNVSPRGRGSNPNQPRDPRVPRGKCS
jgi:hypothetical protein